MYRGRGRNRFRDYNSRDNRPYYRDRSREQYTPKPEKIEREKTCPFLIRIFWKVGDHRRPEEYNEKDKLPQDEVQIHTWKDCTLRELTNLIQQVVPQAKRRGSKISYTVVYIDTQGKPRMRHLGTVFAITNRPGREDNRTLHELKFEIGDYIDVSIN